MKNNKNGISYYVITEPPVFKPIPINLDISAIVAIDEDWSIGKDNDLLVYNKDDLKYFKQLTETHTVVMGRKTLESLPGKKALPNRTNIILSRDLDYNVSNIIVVNSVDALISTLNHHCYNSKDNKVFIMGGESIYKELLPYCNTVYITKTYGRYQGDKFFPNIEQSKDWELLEFSELKYFEDIPYRFIKYKRIYDNTETLE